MNMKRSIRRHLCILTAILALFSLTACSGDRRGRGSEVIHSSTQHETDSPDWVKALPAAKDNSVKQLFVVAGMGMDKTTATVSMHERDNDGNWSVSKVEECKL